MYERAKSFRSRFYRTRGPYDHLLASVRRPGVRIEMYHISFPEPRSLVVLVDDNDRKRLPFDHESRVEGHISSKAAIHWFTEYCKRYGVKGPDVDRAIRKLWEGE